MHSPDHLSLLVYPTDQFRGQQHQSEFFFSFSAMVILTNPYCVFLLHTRLIDFHPICSSMYTRARSPSRTRGQPPPIPHATRPPPSPHVSLPGPAHPLMSQPSRPPPRPPPMPIPVVPNPSPPSNIQQSSRINHTYSHAHTQAQVQSQFHRPRNHHHSQPTSAVPQAIHRTTSSQQLRFAPTGHSPSRSLQRASSSQNLHRSYSSQHLRAPTPHPGGHSGNYQRPRVHSAGNAQKPVILPQQQVQPRAHQHVVQHNGQVHSPYSKCTGRKKALCVSTERNPIEHLS
jgi:hypothetical protein